MRLRTALCLAALSAAPCATAHAQGVAPFNSTLGASPQMVVGTGPWRFFRILNASPAGGVTMWCTRVQGGTPAPNAPGSFPILPGSFEAYATPGYVPAQPTMCVGQNAAVTAEAY